MLSRVIHQVLSFTKLGEFLNSRKTIIGAVLTVAAGLLRILEQIVPMFPDTQYLVDAQVNLSAALDTVISTLESLGFGFLTVGLVHKQAKKKLD